MKPIDVYIYKLDLNVENPVVEKFPAQVREGSHGDEVIRWIGPNDYSVWHSEFDTLMLGVVNEPLDNVVELIVRRDSMTSDKALMLIQNYCCKKQLFLEKRLTCSTEESAQLQSFIFVMVGIFGKKENPDGQGI